MSNSHVMNEFPSLTALYERYKVPYSEIIFENQTYKFVRTDTQEDVRIDIYRNEEDRHTVKVYLANNVVYYVDAYYSIAPPDAV